MYSQVDFNGIRARSEAEQRREREREERRQRINKERINKVLKEIEGKYGGFFFLSYLRFSDPQPQSIFFIIKILFVLQTFLIK